MSDLKKAIAIVLFLLCASNLAFSMGEEGVTLNVIPIGKIKVDSGFNLCDPELLGEDKMITYRINENFLHFRLKKDKCNFNGWVDCSSVLLKKDHFVCDTISGEKKFDFDGMKVDTTYGHEVCHMVEEGETEATLVGNCKLAVNKSSDHCFIKSPHLDVDNLFGNACNSINVYNEAVVCYYRRKLNDDKYITHSIIRRFKGCNLVEDETKAAASISNSSRNNSQHFVESTQQSQVINGSEQ